MCKITSIISLKRITACALYSFAPDLQLKFLYSFLHGKKALLQHGLLLLDEANLLAEFGVLRPLECQAASQLLLNSAIFIDKDI
jgi:hypothetical protein